MVFLTVGEKIRTLRKRFGMRQQEIEDENITRAFISMIETGKRGVSAETAKVIAKKFNDKAEKLGIDFFIDENYFLRTPAEEAELYCIEKLNSELCKEELQEVLSICKSYKLISVEARTYEMLGDYEFKDKNYTSSFVNYMLSLDLYKDTEDRERLPYLYNKLGCCKIGLVQYSEAMSLLNRSNYYSKLQNNKCIEKDSSNNLERVLKKLQNIKAVEEEIKECYNLIEKYTRCSDLQNLKNTYIKLLDIIKNCESYKGEAAKIYNKLALLYLEENDIDMCKRYLTIPS